MSCPLVVSLAGRLVTLCLIQRHEMPFSRQLCILSHPVVDNLARWLVTLGLVQLIQRHNTSFSRQLCAMSRPLLDDFCRTTRHFMSNSTTQDVFFLANLHKESPSCCQSCTTTRYFTSNSTSQDAFFKTTLRIESSSCWQSRTRTHHFMSNSTTQDVFFLTNLRNESSTTPPCHRRKLTVCMRTSSFYVGLANEYGQHRSFKGLRDEE